MKLVVTTPREIIVEREGVLSLRAEDASGSFGILPGHADLLTVLTPSILSWRDVGEREGFAAVRGGVLVVQGGDEVLVATPEALTGDDLAQLERDIAAFGRQAGEVEHQVRTDAARMQIAAIRHIQRYIDAGRAAGVSERGGPP